MSCNLKGCVKLSCQIFSVCLLLVPVIFFRAENIVEEMTVVALALVSAPVKGDFTTLLKTFSQVFHMFRFRIPMYI